MLKENVIVMKEAPPLNLNVTTQNFISTEFYHIGIKNHTADKQFIDRYTRQNFCLQFLRLVNRLYEVIHKIQMSLTKILLCVTVGEYYFSISLRM